MEFSEILISIMTALVGIIGFFVKRAYDSLNEKATKEELKAVEKKVEKNADDISKIRGNYLTKDDYFREQKKLENKVDMILKILIEANKGGSS